MFILYSKIYDFKNITEFDLGKSVLKVKNIKFLLKSYIYCFYYNKIITDMPESDLEQFGIFEAPFDKCVFVFKDKSDNYFKLNCTTSPPSYYLSSFDPSTGQSNIISDKPKDIYTYLKKNLFLPDWGLYKELIMVNFSKNDNAKYDEFGNVILEEEYVNESLNLLQFEPQNVIVDNVDESYGDYDEYNKLSISQRKAKLENLKKDLNNAIKLEELNQLFFDSNKTIKKLEDAKAFIDNKYNLLTLEQKKLEGFSSIEWFTDKEYDKASKYIKEKKYLKKEEGLTSSKVENIDKKINELDLSAILRHRVFMPTIILACISYSLSWILRSNFWYLSLFSVVFFSISFYYLWEYADQLKYSLGLRREKRFFIRKLEKLKSGFTNSFSRFERLLAEKKVDNVSLLIGEYDKLKELKEKISKEEKVIEEFKENNFSKNDEIELEKLYEQNKDLENKISKYDSSKLVKQDIEYKLARLKSSIKKYEKEEMSTFSLDDEIEVDDEKQVSLEDLTHKYKVNGYNLLEIFSRFMGLSIDDFFDRVIYKWMDLVDVYVHSDFDIVLDSEEMLFRSKSELKEWDDKYEKIVEFFMKYSFANLLESILFVDVSSLQKELDIDIFASISNTKNIQIIYE